MNRNYAKPKADMTPEFAPDVLVINGRKVYNPKGVHCRIAGYLPLSHDAPAGPPQGKHYERSGKIEANGADGWRWEYVLVDDPSPLPRRWTRLALKTALAQAEMLDAARQYLSRTNIENGYTAWEALTDADYIEEGFSGEERWNAILDGAAAALGRTRAEVDAFLAAVPTEGY